MPSFLDASEVLLLKPFVLFWKVLETRIQYCWCWQLVSCQKKGKWFLKWICYLQIRVKHCGKVVALCWSDSILDKCLYSSIHWLWYPCAMLWGLGEWNRSSGWECVWAVPIAGGGTWFLPWRKVMSFSLGWLLLTQALAAPGHRFPGCWWSLIIRHRCCWAWAALMSGQAVAVERNIRGMGKGDQLIPWSELPK